MVRFYTDCREFPSDLDCTVTIAADSVDELIEAAAGHAVAVHEHEDGDELRESLRGMVHEGAPPA